MIEAVMIWNEPNNKSHWDPELDPEWARFAHMATVACQAIHRENPHLPRVLGGISPIDPHFIRNMAGRGVLDNLDVVAVHGFPLDWNLWQIHEWPDKLAEIRAETGLPVWVTEVGVSTFGAEEVQSGSQSDRRTARRRTPRITGTASTTCRAPGKPRRASRGEAPPTPPFPHGAAVRGRDPEAGARRFCAPHARSGTLPVVPFRGSPVDEAVA